MSWGERSCKAINSDPKECNPTIQRCNVDCARYEWDRVTKPDSVSKRETVLNKDELAAARADHPPPLGMKGYLDAGDVKAMDRGAKIAITALRQVARNMLLRNYGKETRELAMLAQLELENLYE